MLSQPVDFEVCSPNVGPSAGLVLRLDEAEHPYLRLTHVFPKCAYVMAVGDPRSAYYARRPFRLRWSFIDPLIRDGHGTWGRISLPAPFYRALQDDDGERAKQIDAAWALIAPVIETFEDERNLSRNSFKQIIKARADASQVDFRTLYRLVARYYYFGRTNLALLPLPRGPAAGQGGYDSYGGASRSGPLGRRNQKRRGRQSKLAPQVGRNDFVVSPQDIEDMVDSLNRNVRRGVTYLTHAYEDVYLADHFRRRHPEIYAEYLAGKRPVPVTIPQYRYYLALHARLDDDLAENLRGHSRDRGYLGSLRASGPAEIAEVDATGGRIYLVASDDRSIVLGKPNIYLIIDRWSRFVLSIYVSLRPASWDELRYALLIAFTSRERRFARLGVDVNDSRWPVGRLPAELVTDRGSEFLGRSITETVAKNLRIELNALPPLLPDGKAIVERVIRELKRRMVASRIKGVYAERPLDPKTKRAAKKSEAAAVTSLAEVYRALVEIVIDHNNRPHRALKGRNRPALTQAGVRPVPRDAYLWGLEHLTGLRSPPLTERDYFRLLLGVDKGTLSNGVLRFRNRPYDPADQTAWELVRSAPARAKAVDVRVDKSTPFELFAVTSGDRWARFTMAPGAADATAGLTMDEEEALTERSALLAEFAEHQSRLERLNRRPANRENSKQKHTLSDTNRTAITRDERLQARAAETDQLKMALRNDIKPRRARTGENTPPTTADWRLRERNERRRLSELIRKQHEEEGIGDE